MKTEAAGCVEHLTRSDRVGYHVDKVIRKKRCRKRIRIQLRRPENLQVVSGTLQQLFDSCKRVFKGPGTVPSSMDVQSLCRILGKHHFYMYNCLIRIILIDLETMYVRISGITICRGCGFCLESRIYYTIYVSRFTS